MPTISFFSLLDDKKFDIEVSKIFKFSLEDGQTIFLAINPENGEKMYKVFSAIEEDLFNHFSGKPADNSETQVYS